MLPQEFCLHTGSIPHRLLKEMLEHLPVGLKGEFLQAMINTQPPITLKIAAQREVQTAPHSRFR